MMANFIEINSSEELDELFNKSQNQAVILFKHSTTCPISSSVYQEVSKVALDIHLVIVQNSRTISYAIAEKTGIRHESPQVIVLKDGSPIYYASHFDITAKDIEEAINY